MLLHGAAAHAQRSDTVTTIRLNGFVDAYYAYDTARPADGERRFTTQPVRHDEVNVNLAWLGVTVERKRTRAHVALQAGTSVQANYAGEPTNGATSGPAVSRFIQEAVVGIRLRDRVWIDGGIYSSYIGLESWSSSDNPTYTRSFVADFTPYYLSGARLTWQATPKLSAQLHLTNGWQNISENNRSKSAGVRLDYSLNPATVISYANFVGNERPSGRKQELRVFNQLMAKGRLPTGTSWQAQLDVGNQRGRTWYGAVAIAKQPLTPAVALVGRVERYADPHQIIVETAQPNAFVGSSASVGVDVEVDAGVRWRSELRTLQTTAALFSSGAASRPSRGGSTLVTSLSFAF